MILITGLAHTGSTALLLLLERLGFTIGREQFPQPVLELLREPRLQAQIDAGVRPVWPDVIKHHGGFCYHLHEHVDRWGWNVEQVFVMTRDLEESLQRRALYAGGREFTHRAFGIGYDEWNQLGTEGRFKIARNHLKDQLGSLIFQLSARDYPFSCIQYPRWVRDFEYTHRKLSVLGIGRQGLQQKFSEMIDLSRVHSYTEQGA